MRLAGAKEWVSLLGGLVLEVRLGAQDGVQAWDCVQAGSVGREGGECFCLGGW